MPTACQVLHRDIKSQNIFIAANGSIKIGDLGVAKLLGTRMQVLIPTPKFVTSFVCLSKQLQFATTVVGTPYYLSPELCEGKPYNEKSDIWAIGVLLYVTFSLSTRKAPHFDFLAPRSRPASYEMCTVGKMPFEASNQGALIMRIIRWADM